MPAEISTGICGRSQLSETEEIETMTNTTFEHLGGVGINAHWRVRRDGQFVANIMRRGNRGWQIESHYSRIIMNAASIDGAKAWCSAQERFRTKRELYDVICAEVEKRRRLHLEDVAARKLTALARALVAGSNSARDDMAALLDEIETLAKDRVEATKPPETPAPSRRPYDEALMAAWRDSRNERFQDQPVKWPYTGYRSDFQYPEPPEQVPVLKSA